MRRRVEQSRAALTSSKSVVQPVLPQRLKVEVHPCRKMIQLSESPITMEVSIKLIRLVAMTRHIAILPRQVRPERRARGQTQLAAPLTPTPLKGIRQRRNSLKMLRIEPLGTMSLVSIVDLRSVGSYFETTFFWIIIWVESVVRLCFYYVLNLMTSPFETSFHNCFQSSVSINS